MKRIAVLLALLCAGGLLASFALADNGGGKGKGHKQTTSGTSTGTSTNGKGKSGKKCHTISLKGTAPATTFTVTVTKANKAGRDLKTATATFSGKVSINGTMCTEGTGATAASTIQLRNLHVAKTSTTTTATP